ncbi:MAG: 4Fe-4S binding protein [Candidatus Omnitrophica bacterium]|nr:4Fe-4S binding protein [Candidatus Omnitrophota bacterium]
MKYKRSQILMLWFLPLITIGGLFNPILGYLVLGMMAFFLTLSYFKGRFWCWNLCPRGAFLDIILSKASFKKPVPKVFTRHWFRWLIFVLFSSFLMFRIIRTGGNIIAIGAVFVSMCIVTTIISIVLGVATRHRSWCMICPMGTLQDKISRMSK